MEAYGVHLEQFNVQSINVPEDDPAVKTLKTALAKRAEMGIVGFNYQQEQSFNVLKTAAGNEGNAGGVMSAGLGLGMGVGLGGPMGQMMASVNTQGSPVANTAATPDAGSSVDRLTALKALAELKAQGILTDEEFDAEKKHILAR